MTLRHIVHHNIPDSLCWEFRSNSFRHLFRISIHTAIYDNHTFVRIITAQTVVDTDHPGNILCPYRSVCRANGSDRQSSQFLQGFLYRTTVFANDIGVVTHHFTPVLIYIDTGIQKSSVYSAKASESVTWEKDSVRFIKCHHRFGPVHHRSHIETKHMLA